MGSSSRSEVTLSHWWTRVVGDGHKDVLDGLLERHREPHRRYHTASHVLWVLRHVDTLASSEPVGDEPAVLAAAFYHDAIYDPEASEPGSNERTSAALAISQLGELGWGRERLERVGQMIEATVRHHVPDAPDGSASSELACDTAVLLDADLAVLGADVAGYQAYVTGVRSEYAHVDDATWTTGRRSVLEGFLQRPSIYATGSGRQRWEARARANITAELASLGIPPRSP